MLRFSSFQGRLLFFFLGLFILVQLIAFFSVNASNKQNALTQIQDDLFVGGKVFDRLLKDRFQRLSEAAMLLSSDFAFKTAFSTGDKATILSAMNNHRARIGANVMMLVSLEHTVIVDSLHPEEQSVPFPFPDLIKTAEQEGKTSAILFIDRHPYQMVIVPLLAPVPVAWIVIGFKIDDMVAKDLQTLTLLDVTFVMEQKAAAPVILASTLPDRLRQSLIGTSHSGSWKFDKTTLLSMDGDKYVSLSLILNKQGDLLMRVILQRSMEAALKPFHRLRSALIVLFASGLIVLLIGGILIARTVTKPVRILAEGAEKIQKGDYRHSVTVKQRDELGKLASAFNHMTSAIAQREEQIKYQAYHDNLTGLPNRAFLHNYLHDTIISAKDKNKFLVLVMLDIDRFKDINAVLGHNTGDLILQKVGPLLNSLLDRSAIVVRMGGDEFALLLTEENSVNSAIDVTQSILKGFESPFWVNENPIQIEASFGIAAYPEHGEDADTLIKHADVAMYLAKGSTNGFSVYSPGLDQYNLRQLTLLGELRHAIEKEELILYYQPKVDINAGHITGVEALLRWEHPQHGFMPPDDFIPLLEKTALIKPLTLWTLNTALSQCSRFHQMSLRIGMAVNVSARMLQDQQLAGYIAKLIDNLNLSPDLLTLEITESAIMAEPEHTFATIMQFDSLGLRLSIDDFGTGYSSLSYLQKLPVDELKIDKSFVKHMDTNDNDAKIVRSIIELAHNLGVKVIAEGVETRQTLDILKSINCDLAQGYLMSKPLPVDELNNWLRESHWGLVKGIS